MRVRSVVVAALLLLAVLVGMAMSDTVVVRDDAHADDRPKATYAYAGNTKSHKFHKESCQYFNCPNCTAKFRTREEAIEAGYRPCGVCRP